MLTFDRFGPLWVHGLIDEPDLTWATTIIRECGFLWDLGYRPTSALFHFRGGGIELAGPRGGIWFESGEDFGSMDAGLVLDGFKGRVDELPNATVGPRMVTHDGTPLPTDHVARRVAEWASTLRANIDLLR
jgi:hypothetical protein